MVSVIDDQWSADLKEIKFNEGYKYVLVVIDVFSKYLWMHSLRDKKGTSVAHALREIFEQGRIPKRIRTDKGQEFRAKEVPDVLNNFGVIHLNAKN